MTFANGYYDSMYGRIESGWKIESNRIIYTATVPANTTATLYLPASPQQKITEGGKDISNANGLEFIGFEKDRAVFKLKSGEYEFVLQILKKNDK
jgi:alpha-L-rhamnosidase